MKKLLILLSAVFTICGALGILSACSGGQLQTDNPSAETPSAETPSDTAIEISSPTNLQWDTDTWTLSWGAAEDAQSYTIYVEQTEEYFYTTQSSYAFEYILLTDSTYTLKVQSINGETSSGWAKVTAQTETSDTALKYTLTADGTGYEVTRINTTIGSGLTGRVVIADYYNNLPVVAIADYAFSYDVLAYINTTTGENCNTVTTDVHLPKCLISIGEYAFAYCLRLEDVYIPDSVVTIGKYAFAYCSKLEEIRIPDSVTTMDRYVFYTCKRLKSVTLSSSMTTISYGAFTNCENLAQIALPDSISEIDQNAFYNCTALTQMTIPDNVTYIGEKAFKGCIGLTEIIIPAGVTYIGSNAFSGCTLLASVTFLATPETMEDEVFDGTAWLDSQIDDYVILNDSILYCYQGTDTEITSLPSQIKYIAGWAFYENSTITTLNIADVTVIGASAFMGCTALVSVTLTDVKVTGTQMFRECLNLKQAELYGDIQTLNERMFFRCESLESILLPDSLQTIENFAIGYCYALKSVIIPDSVTQIGTNAFNKCTALEEIVIGSGVTTILESAFNNCTALTSVFYNGIALGWNKITIDTTKNSAILEDATIYYYSEVTPILNKEGTAYDGNFWHYDESGNPVAWVL